MPELELQGADRPLIPDLAWASLSHRQVLSELVRAGWVPCAVGDWAVALRSPEGSLVARVCPFDPAYPAFIDLCRACTGNQWLPEVELAADLEGGGSVAFQEFAAPADQVTAAQVAGQWTHGTGDAQFEDLRQAARRIDAEYRNSVPWWDGFDLNSAHVRKAADGRLVLIDIFRMDGASLYGKILEDVAEVHRQIPRERMRYALEIPYIARESSAAQIRALRNAWTRVG